MSWLFWVLLVVLMLFGIQGFRKGLLKTVLSMVSTFAVILITAWLVPQVSTYISENTSFEATMQENVEAKLLEYLGDTIELPISTQIAFIEELPFPQIMKDSLIENNNSAIYERLEVSDFTGYLSKYIVQGLLNGISFIIAFIITLIIIRLIVFVINIVTELPVIGTLDQLGGFVIGLVHGIFWIAILFLVIFIAGDTEIGGMLMETIQGDKMLSWIYDKNTLIEIIMKITA